MTAKKKETSPKQLSLFGLLDEVKLAEDESEPGETMPNRREQYYEAKMVLRALEKKNNRYVYLIASPTGPEGEWYIVGDNSALFYKYFLGPRMGRKAVKIHSDTDSKYKFRIGVTSVHWLKNFQTKVEELGYELQQLEYGVVRVELEKKFTATEIKNYYKLEKEDEEKLMSILKPKDNFPGLYTRIRCLIQYVGPKMARIRAEYRPTVGNEMMRMTMELMRFYQETANEFIGLEEGVFSMRRVANSMKAMLVVMDELNLLDPTTRARMGQMIVEVELSIGEYQSRCERKKNGKDKEKDGQEGEAESGQADDESEAGEPTDEKNNNE